MTAVPALTNSRALSPRSASKSQVFRITPWLYFFTGLLIGHLHGTLTSTTVGSNDTTLSTLPTMLSAIHTKTAHTNTHKSEVNSDWRTIHVYKGNITHVSDEMLRIQSSNFTSADAQGKLWFSQARQDELITALFRNKADGYFVDLAANDAVKFSNTLALDHWHGLCIEPNPMYWYNLTMMRNNCELVAAVVGQQRNEQVYFRYEAGDHGGVAGDGFDNGKRWQSHSKKVATVTLLEIFERFDTPPVIDYLSLDVEGAETFIMMNFPLDRYNIKAITAERLRGPIRAYLKEHGFEFVKKLTRWGESLWINERYKSELDIDAIEQFGFPLF